MATLSKRVSKSKPKKNNTQWYIIEYYTENGTKKKQYIENLGYISHTEAKVLLDKYNVHNTNKPKSRGKVTVGTAFEDFAKLYKQMIGDTVKPRTYDIFEYHSKRIIDFMGFVELAKLEYQNVEAFKLALKNEDLSNKSVNLYLSELKKVLDYSVKKKWIPDYPKIEMLPLKRSNQPIEVLSREEIDILLEQSGHSQKFYLKLMIFTGMRPVESSRLKWENINFDQGYIDIISDNPLKRGRTIPIHPRIKDMLIEADKSCEYVSPYLDSVLAKKAMKRLSVKTGIVCNPYKLRKTFGSILAQSGVDTVFVAKLMGHADLQTTYKYYLRLKDENLIEAINKL
ncbi:MAG: hypothetical protein A2X42_04050 [Candidatus Margulisbacteria bacterium GWF2_38_17]|nr:MAG: hypothetical protein A2X42_04050 [Candidatus Margulisbacteria bacterium GWF2_38_17]